MKLPSQRSHWNAHASRWEHIGPPLRPAAEDVRHVQQSVARFLPSEGATRRRALLLGVTPELARIAWEPPVQLLAVDKSQGMADGVWPADTELRRVQVGDWLLLDGMNGAFDLALGDGVFTLLDYPRGYRALGAKLAEVVRPAGLLCLRLFCRPAPAEREEVAAVFEALLAGQIGNFHVFKWRLAMALHDDDAHGVRLADVWDAFEARVPSVAALAARTGFPHAEIATIEGYRGVEDRYSYSTVTEVEGALQPALRAVGRMVPKLRARRALPAPHAA